MTRVLLLLTIVIVVFHYTSHFTSLLLLLLTTIVTSLVLNPYWVATSGAPQRSLLLSLIDTEPEDESNLGHGKPKAATKGL